MRPPTMLPLLMLTLVTTIVAERLGGSEHLLTSGGSFFYVGPGWTDSRTSLPKPDELTAHTNGVWTARQWGEEAPVPAERRSRRIRMPPRQFVVETSSGAKELVFFNKGRMPPTKCDVDWGNYAQLLQKRGKTQAEAEKQVAETKKKDAEANGLCAMGCSVDDENFPVCDAEQIVNDEMFPISRGDAEVLAVSGHKGMQWLERIIALRKWNGPVLIICGQLERCNAKSLFSLIKYTDEHRQSEGGGGLDRVRFLLVIEHRRRQGREAQEFSHYYMDWMSKLENTEGRELNQWIKEGSLIRREAIFRDDDTSMTAAQSDELGKYLTMAQAFGDE